MFKWVITQDVISEGESTAVGRGNHKGPMVALPFEFRLKDDDDNVYYYGRANECDSEEAFEPLDWAMNDSGCTSIEYKLESGWEQL